MGDAHSRIIASAGKAELEPLGFRQQGRSRLWFADRGFWLNIVEFTPSSWSKRVSLTNAAHWLWLGAGFTGFNEAVRSAHADYENDDQFKASIATIASTAGAKATEFDRQFSSIESTAAFVIDRARSSRERMALSWWGYEAGIASGLLNRFDDARSFLGAITDERVAMKAVPFLPLVEDAHAFRSKMSEMVDQERRRLDLKPLARPAF